MEPRDDAVGGATVPGELPRAPRELVHPLRLPGAGIPGSPILEEIGGRDGLVLWMLHRAVLAWSACPENSGPDPDAWAALDRLEFALLSRPDPIGAGGGLLAGYMRDGSEAKPEDVAWACLFLADHASDLGAKETALEFARAAAYAWPRHARYAFLVGCMHRAADQPAAAEQWFRRAYRVAVWTGDAEAQVQCLRGLVSLPGFPVSEARRLVARALRVARLHGLASLEAEVRSEHFASPASHSSPPGRRAAREAHAL